VRIDKRRAVVPAVVAALLAAPALAACSGGSQDAVRTAATTFLGDWSAGKLPAAAGETTDAQAATTLLQQTAKDLPGATLSTRTGAVKVTGSTATVAWTATWHLAAAPDWSYGATLPLRQAGDAWRVVAQPTVVHPDLAAGQHLQLTRTLPARAAITDAAGTPLFTPTEVVNVGVDPGKVTDLPALAATLGAATGVDPAQITTDVQKGKPGQFVPVITLRRADFDTIRAQVYDLPGAVFPTATRQLAPTSRFALGLLGRVGDATAEVLDASKDASGKRLYAAGDQLGLSGLQRAYQQQLTGTAGYTVTVVSTDASTGDTGRQLATVAPAPGTPVRTPLVTAVQNAADAATATQPLPTDMVVVRPGTGEILAVSSNAQADPSHALAGRFPPGSTMKTMTATALLSAGKVTPDTPVPCPGTTVVDGRSFQNENQFDLGTVPLTTAFDQSCNTTFIQQGMTLPDDALAQAAASYGVGTSWKLPVPLFGGTVPADATGTAKAADQIGQGQVLLSPAALALVAAGIASGKPAPPVEVTGAPAAGTIPTGPAAAVLDQLRPMMRQVALVGTAKLLAGRPDVYGKTGTAEFGTATPPQAHGWFMGYQLGGPQGDLAFAVLVEGGNTSTLAVKVTDAFLGALG
jgi:cell division protein FtsI/penicillin-binding protein 2